MRSLRLQVWNGGGVPIGRSIPIAIGRIQTPSGRWMRVGIGGNGVRWSGIRGYCARSEHGNSKRSTDKFGDYLHVFSSFIILLRDLPGEVPENLSELIFMESTFSCASEPFAHGVALRKEG